MAQMVLEILRDLGHQVEIISHLRSFTKTPDDPKMQEIREAAEQEFLRLDARFEREADRPDLWFCYHPYYKSPDLFGPPLCRHYAIPYVTLEASHSRRRDPAGWASLQEYVREAIGQAVANICLTKRDAAGISDIKPDAWIDQIKPFLKIDAFKTAPPLNERRPGSLVTVAMMRSGDKLSSYQVLAEALGYIVDESWHLDIVGDGKERPTVEALFSRFGQERVTFHGEQSTENVRMLMGQASIYLWPGLGEAYGLAYLEAQAMGLPVIAYDVAGVSEVVDRSRGGILVQSPDPVAYALELKKLLNNDDHRLNLAKKAQHCVITDHSFEAARDRIEVILQAALERFRRANS